MTNSYTNSKLAPAVTLVLGLLMAQRPAVPQDAGSTESKLEVHATYTGTGPVDQKHKVFVVLWDTPEFIKGSAMPISIESTASKNAPVTFSGLTKGPVYVSAVYDSKGEWDGQSGPPPEGSPIGLYSKDPPKPEPIELKPGKTATAQFSFNDDIKMQAGGPNR